MLTSDGFRKFSEYITIVASQTFKDDWQALVEAKLNPLGPASSAD